MFYLFLTSDSVNVIFRLLVFSLIFGLIIVFIYGNYFLNLILEVVLCCYVALPRPYLYQVRELSVILMNSTYSTWNVVHICCHHTNSTQDIGCAMIANFFE